MGRKIVDYEILKDEYCDSLVTSVQQKIREGWQPLGGVAFSIDSLDNPKYHFQAIVKYEGDK